MLLYIALGVAGITALIWFCLLRWIYSEGIGWTYAIWHDAGGRLQWMRCTDCDGTGVQWLNKGVLMPIPPELRSRTHNRRRPKLGNVVTCRTCNEQGRIASRELVDPRFADRLHDGRWPKYRR